MSPLAFTFDDVCITPDRQIGRHSHPRWELSLVICGVGKRTIGDLTEPMEEGEIILIPPDIPHVWEFDPSHTDSEGNIANITLFFETSTLDSLAIIIPELEGIVSKLRTCTEAISFKGDAYNRVYGLLMSMRGLTPASRVPKMIELLIAMANAEKSVSAGKNNVLSRRQQRLENVRIYCSCNYARDVSLDEIATYVGMNKSAFCTFMRNDAGMSFSEFMNSFRLERAMDMLRHTDKNISEIAYDCGFANAAYFHRLFRKKYHCTPKSARKDEECRDRVGLCRN